MAALIDTRAVGKLGDFSGAPTDWSDWSFKATAWFALLNPPGMVVIEVLDSARDHAVPLRSEDFSEAVRSFSSTMFNVLVQVVKAKALGIVKTGPRLNGLESWRRLFLEYESSSGTRLNALLGGILNPSWQARPGHDFMEMLLQWEQCIDDYERQSDEMLSNALKAAVLTQHAPQSVRAVLLPYSHEHGTDYVRLKAMVSAFLSTAKSYNAQGVAEEAPTAMDVSALTSGERCSFCGKPGHSEQHCWKKGQKGEHGKGKGKSKNAKGKGKGKDGHGGKGGKGKDHGAGFAGYCRWCNSWGHKKSECQRYLQSARDRNVNALAAQGPLALTDAPGRPPPEVSVTTTTRNVAAITKDTDFEINDEANRWIMAISRGIASVEAFGDGERILIDSGSAEHVCPKDWHSEIETTPTQDATKLRDVQGKIIQDVGLRTVKFNMENVNGNGVLHGGARFTACRVREPVLSAGKMVEKGAIIHLEMGNSFIMVNGEKTNITFESSRAFVNARVVAAVNQEEESAMAMEEEVAEPGAERASSSTDVAAQAVPGQ